VWQPGVKALFAEKCIKNQNWPAFANISSCSSTPIKHPRAKNYAAGTN
jgi:hypothetical protein